MIRQTEIPGVAPGEPISASLMNQLIKGANTARVVTTDGTLDITNVAGILGMGTPGTVPPLDATVFVKVVTTDNTGTGGLYNGLICVSPFVSVDTYSKTSIENFIGGTMECKVWNLEEMNSTKNSLLGYTDLEVMGRVVGNAYSKNTHTGTMTVKPLVAVYVSPPSGIFECIVKQNGTSGGNPAYDIYFPWDTSYTRKLNSSALVPKCSRARWQTALTVTGATDGSVGIAYKDMSRNYQLYDCQEFVPMGACV